MTNQTATPHELALSRALTVYLTDLEFPESLQWSTNFQQHSFKLLETTIQAYLTTLLNDPALVDEVAKAIWPHIGNIGIDSPKLEAAAQAAIAAVSRKEGV